MTIAIIGHVRVAPEAIDAARPAMAAVIAATREEPGCISYAFAEDVLDPGLIRVSEMWRSREDLAAHFQQPHMAVWRAELGKVGMLERDLTLIDVAGTEQV